ncbi:MAG: hypothetical protein A3I32_00210 [Candidatus Yanofskybacteria bacterium RIFCSPLOWO2_02_FULL_45_10]|uniref:UDP-N-acetylmuramoyl-tripeptide--D-alanyl-D-alanine ligase n=2 Tax=Candidatus Yanofskyibacteriota TaxID=1752733 RepID=A0A1F8G584_9BACT|nr:MAG: hypothetical protein A3F25_00740 [Candidatus Yanofskybacteria bacterium RIFCSPHIGHO2_12_FULL_45_19b]OGN31631.1 MAG: hypothetical protein A3I32_00210 [Candidatus Yanofskybacteria bacterium RIFCSPLOWO2_02_FULL_45_10]
MFKLLASILTILARAQLARFKPEIIGVTGNVGKTTTKEMIGAVLSSHKRVRLSGGNLNNEVGLPLAILGNWTEEYYSSGSSPWFWGKVIWRGVLDLLSPKATNYPEVTVLEYGADHPGDIERLVKNFPPQVAVLNAVGEIPSHVEFFPDATSLAKEKVKLIDAVKANGLAVVNGDDALVMKVFGTRSGESKRFGFNPGTDYQVSAYHININMNNKPTGVAFNINHDGEVVEFKINGSLGKAQALAAAAAVAVGKRYGISLGQASVALAKYSGPAGRLKVLGGIKNATIIDDSYNASPAAVRVALEALEGLPVGRKVAVLGDMLELGEYTIQAHEQVGQMVGKVVDVLVCVGERAKLIAAEARKQISPENVKEFNNSLEAAKVVQELIQSGDFVLVKGSQGIRMERVVEEIMAEPGNKNLLLVRQSKKWQNKK